MGQIKNIKLHIVTDIKFSENKINKMALTMAMGGRTTATSNDTITTTTTSIETIPLEQIDNEIKEMEDALKDMRKTEMHLMSTIEVLTKRAEEHSITEGMLRLQRMEMQSESAEVEYKRRLQERFSYKNVDTIKKIYKENRETAAKAH